MAKRIISLALIVLVALLVACAAPADTPTYTSSSQINAPDTSGLSVVKVHDGWNIDCFALFNNGQVVGFDCATDGY